MKAANDRYLRMFYDAQFTELSQRAKLISIGIQSTSGSYFYAEFKYDENEISYSDWIKENIIENLVFNDHIEVIDKIANPRYDLLYSVEIKMDPDVISEQLREWLRNESDILGNIEFYTDCYEYGWMLLNNLICENGNALNIPDFISYIPMDLSTAFNMIGEDPDIIRENYISPGILDEMSRIYPFSNSEIRHGSYPKHNALWDAIVCEKCFEKIILKQHYMMRRLHDEETLI